MTAVATVTRPGVERVKNRDRDFDGYQGVLLARMGAVIGAQRATAAGEIGARLALPAGELDAHFALRQSLVDLAAISELLADDMRRERHSGHPQRGA
jgi:hypothetical protein